MKQDRPSAVQPDQAAAPKGRGSAARGTGHGQAAIVVVGRNADVPKALGEELSGRYGADYRIVVCDESPVLDQMIRELLADGTPVALVIGEVGEADPDGIEVLARVRGIDRTISRVAAVRWGEWDIARPVFDAITMGKIDHWVTRPVQSPDEQFHESITRFLGEWSTRREPARGVRRRRRPPRLGQTGRLRRWDGAITIPLVHRYLEGLAVPEVEAR